MSKKKIIITAITLAIIFCCAAIFLWNKQTPNITTTFKTDVLKSSDGRAFYE